MIYVILQMIHADVVFDIYDIFMSNINNETCYILYAIYDILNIV